MQGTRYVARDTQKGECVFLCFCQYHVLATLTTEVWIGYHWDLQANLTPLLAGKRD